MSCLLQVVGTLLGSQPSEGTSKCRISGQSRIIPDHLIGNGTLAIRRPDASGANYTQWFADEIASKGAGGLPEVDKRGTPTGRVARSIGDVPVTPEGSSGPMYVLTGERALQYADARGFSLGQAVESLL